MTEVPKAVLITGSARRIGRALALDLAGHGWRVVVHYHGSDKDALALVAEIKAAGGMAVLAAADLANAYETSGLVAQAQTALGAPLTALINNASVFNDDRLETFTAESWQHHMAVNLLAPAILTQHFAAALPKGTKGAVVNMIDQRVLKLNPQYFSYTASKSGLLTLTRTMAQALAPDIRVNAIGPGPTLKNSRQTPEMFAQEAAKTLLGHGPELQEICDAVRFLLVNPSITGQMLALDGGQHLVWRTADILED